MNVAENIKAIREAKRIKQLEIATALGIDPSNYAKLEKRGNKLTVEQLETIAKALGVSVVELITGKEQTIQNDKKIEELEMRVDYWFEMAEARSELLRITEKYLHGYSDFVLSELKDIIYTWLEDNEGKYGIDENTTRLPITELPPTILEPLYRECISKHPIIDYAIHEGLLWKKGEVFKPYHTAMHKEAMEAMRETKRRMEERRIENLNKSKKQL